MKYACEKFDSCIKSCEEYLSIEKNEEIAYLQIIALASSSKYDIAIKKIDNYIDEYSPGDKEKNLLMEKRALYKNGLTSKPFPILKPADISGNVSVKGLYVPDDIAIAYNYSSKKTEAYSINNGKLAVKAIPDFPPDTEFEKMLNFSMSADGTQMFASFVEDGFDDDNEDTYILYSEKKGKWSKWTKPDRFNESDCNSFPVFLKDDKSIMFISDRNKSNGLDIFFSYKESGNKWSDPELVLMANTNLNEASLYVLPDKSIVYFSTNGRAGMGGYDVYGARIKYGFNKIHFEDITNIEDINTFRNEFYPPLIDSKTSLCLLNFSESDKESIYYTSNIGFFPFKKKTNKITLSKVQFDFGSAILKSESYVYLDEIADYMTKETAKIITIYGHYLTAKGIAAERISVKGMGAEKNIDTNDTDEGRRLNRRVEIEFSE